MFAKNIKSAGDAEQDAIFPLGRQLSIEYYDCGAKVLLNKARVEKAVLTAAGKSGATVISSSFHQFEPQGVSGVVVIAESHFAVHAWPEHDYAAVDIFTCSDSIDLEVAINSMKNSFESENVVISSDQNRGIISKPVKQNQVGLTIENLKIYPVSWKKNTARKDPRSIFTSVDIYESDPQVFLDKDHIKRFVSELCDRIDMTRATDYRVVHAEKDGKIQRFSMAQDSDTSLISGHFDPALNAVYLDIFSCKFYEPREVAEFALSFFKGDHYKIKIAVRQ